MTHYVRINPPVIRVQLISVAIDFSVLGDTVRGQNYQSRGGTLEAISAERATQNQRELTELMVHYTSLSGIPPSPREPSESSSGDHLMEESFGKSTEEWFTVGSLAKYYYQAFG